MSGVKFFTDEDVYAAVAPALTKAGGDAVSTPEALDDFVVTTRDGGG